MASLFVTAWAAGCGGVDVSPADPDVAAPTVEVSEEIVGCDLGDAVDTEAPGTVDLGSIAAVAVADAERVTEGDATTIAFTVVVEPDDPDAELPGDDPGRTAILQARAGEGSSVLLRLVGDDDIGADVAGPVSVLSFARCDEPKAHEVVLSATAPTCVALVANDPSTGGFTELPVSAGTSC